MASKSLSMKYTLFVIVLTLMGSSRGLRQKTKSSEMERDLKKVEAALKEHLLETVLNIRVSVTMIEVFADDAKERIVYDLKSAAQGFWKTIKMLQDAAAGDVPGCVTMATKNLKELDDLVVLEAHNKLENILLEAEEEAAEAISESRSFLSEISPLAEQIENCNAGLCKIVLHDQILELLTDSWETIEEACNDIIAYRKEKMNILKKFEVDLDAYLEAYMPIIKNVTSCIFNT